MAETHSESDGQQPPRRWRFSLAQMMTLVLVICVALGVWSANRSSWVRDVEEVLLDPDPTFHQAYLEHAYNLPPRQSHSILAKYAAASPQRAWFPEQEVILFLDETYEQYGDEDFVMLPLCFYRPGEERPEFDIFGFSTGLEIQRVTAVGEDEVEIEYRLLPSLAADLGVSRTRGWRARMPLAELLEYIDTPNSMASRQALPRCQWLLERSTGEGRAEAVPGDEAAR